MASSGLALCESCGAFVPFGPHATLGPVGTCARNVRSFPVTASGTCSEHRPRGTGHQRAIAPLRTETSRRAAAHALPLARPRPELPQELDLDMDMATFRTVLTQVLREELGLGEEALGARWPGGELILKPGKEGTAEKRMPIETFFHKIVMIRDKLRVLEQRLNAHATLSDEEKLAMQQYITGCYGTLTSFNVLFSDPVKQGFRGASGKDD